MPKFYFKPVSSEHALYRAYCYMIFFYHKLYKPSVIKSKASRRCPKPHIYKKHGTSIGYIY